MRRSRSRLRRDDGTDSGPAATAAHAVANSAPVATVALAPASPTTSQTLTATATKADADGDTVTLTYVWKVGATVVRTTAASSSLTDTLDLSQAGNGDAGQSVSVTVTPSDGAASGAAAGDTVTVANTAPTASVTLAPAAPTTNGTLTASVAGADDDGDPLTYTYVWRVNGAVVRTTPAGAATSDALDLSQAGNGDRGDTVSVTVTPKDGTAPGSAQSASQVVANSVPTASVSLDTAAPKTDELLIATATKSDADGEPVSLTYVWKVDGTVRKTTSGSSGTVDTFNLATAGNGDKGQVVTVDVTPNDGHVDGPGASDTALVANTAPVVDSVAIDQGSPRTGDTLSATVLAHDADGDPVTLAYEWTKNGQPLLGQTGVTLDLAAFGHGDRGESVGLTVTPSDATSTGAPRTSATVTVANTAPAATVVLDATSPKTDDTVTATATGSDPDAEPVRFTYVWKVAGVAVRTTAGTLATTDSLDLSQAGFGDRGQAVAVEVTPTDGTLVGSSATDAATVANSAPTLTVALDDTAPRSNAILTANATRADADGDPVTLTYVWKVNGVTRKTTTATAATADTLDLGVAGNGDDNDVVTVDAVASDGTDSSPSRNASATVGVDHLPVATVALSTTAPKTDDTLTATATKTDGDGDPVTLTYVWKVNGATVKTTAGSSALTDTLDLSAAGHGDKGQTVSVDVTANDTFVDGATVTATATVANSAPAVDTVAVDEGAPTTNDTLHLTVTAHDPDAADTLTYGYQWRKGGAAIPGATAATLDLSTAGNGDRGDAIVVDVTANDGSTASPALRAAAVTVADTAPTATVSLAPASPTTNRLLTATATTADDDGDTVSLAYVWKLNGTVVAGETGPTFDLAAHGDRGDSVSVEATPNDGTLDGAAATDSVTVVDSAPTAAVSLAPASPTTNRLLTATATTADDDGDTVSLAYVWKLNGTVVAGETGPTFDLAAHGDRGDTVSVEATPNDGTLDGAVASDSLVVANSAPTASVTLAPTAPATNQTVTATTTTADVDGDSVTVAYGWKLNGAVVPGENGPSFDLAAHGDAGDVLSVTATPNDGSASGAAASAQVTVANTAPTATVALDTASPKTNDTLTATATRADADGQPVSLTYVWKVNGVTRRRRARPR